MYLFQKKSPFPGKDPVLCELEPLWKILLGPPQKMFKFVSYSISLQLQGTFLLVQLITM